MDAQPSLFDLPLAPRTPWPDGFRYQDNLITRDEERDLIARFQELPFKPYEHLGYFGNRRIAGFGWRQDEAGRMVETGEPIPGVLLPLLAKVAAFTGLPGDSFRHALVTEYSPGAGIGWHRDRPRRWPSPACRWARPARSACVAGSAKNSSGHRSPPRRARPI